MLYRRNGIINNNFHLVSIKKYFTQSVHTAVGIFTAKQIETLHSSRTANIDTNVKKKIFVVLNPNRGLVVKCDKKKKRAIAV